MQITKIEVIDPQYIEGIHDRIPYLLPFGTLRAYDENGNCWESSDCIEWTCRINTDEAGAAKSKE